ncbi:hypothetical protein [Entomomonas asaccharolytica]|uniref:Uncharacterized protein n=1 Tax=Entomomonas asaccharolytica TaxID=2785331 RepID=A0A974RXE2_9GAMM|nr:hypothetical protein [Entomomonas asaccharolytica]QQP84754.1 hypothetical protein JHT90_10090 [Entomomonas asaccharolytica]
MAIYTIQFQIQSNASVEDLGYQLEVYKTVNDIPRYALHQTPITSLQADYKTQLHKSLAIDPSKDQHFVMYFMLYRKSSEGYSPVFDTPQTKVYSLENPPTLSDNKIENIRYFETKGVSKPQYANHEINTTVVKITAQKRPFEDQLHKEGTDKDPFSKDKIEQQLQDRLMGFNYPHQQRTSLCGAAAFFYCLLKDQPDIYKQVVKDLWHYGNVQIGNLTIKPSDGCRYPNGIYRLGISGLDWITLASLRDTENTIMSYKARTGFVFEGLAGITMVSAAKSWFEKVGANCVFDNTMLWTPFGLNHAKLKHLLDLNLYADKANYHVVVLIGSGMFGAYNENGYIKPSKDHWVVWESKITLLDGEEITEATPLTEKVKLKAFSWGKVEENYIRPELTLDDVLEHMFGGFVVTKIL